ncbi:MAG: hypothetical protein XD81_1270 [Bacteroidetes bacterium 38_7]|nr:MAG: hypothetical protein XD81_1270 [Bacteroidetes bacterium 38_7]HAL65120.1 cell shape determination protein CcmA [Bacteroidales bacterium]
MAKTTVIENPIVNIIGSMTSIEGDVSCGGDIRIEGQLRGKLDCKGKVVIAESGSVDGEIYCRNGDFAGKIKGSINTSELLTLKSTVVLQGDITCSKLAIEPGARFNGKCIMELPENNQGVPKNERE